MPEQFRHMKMPNLGEAWMSACQRPRTLKGDVTYPLRARGVAVDARIVAVLLLDLQELGSASAAVQCHSGRSGSPCSWFQDRLPTFCSCSQYSARRGRRQGGFAGGNAVETESQRRENQVVQPVANWRSEA